MDVFNNIFNCPHDFLNSMTVVSFIEKKEDYYKSKKPRNNPLNWQVVSQAKLKYMIFRNFKWYQRLDDDSNTGGSDLWSNTLPLDYSGPRYQRLELSDIPLNISCGYHSYNTQMYLVIMVCLSGRISSKTFLISGSKPMSNIRSASSNT